LGWSWDGEIESSCGGGFGWGVSMGMVESDDDVLMGQREGPRGGTVGY
jgi:hypothetical protein